MPVLTKRPPEVLPQGTYVARCGKVMVQKPDDNQNGKFQQQYDQLVYPLTIRSVIHAAPVRPTKEIPEPRQPEDWANETIRAYSGTMLNEGTKGYDYACALLDRDIDDGEEIDTDDYEGCHVEVQIGRTSNGNAKVIGMMPYHRPAAKPKAAKAAPPPEDADDDQADLDF